MVLSCSKLSHANSCADCAADVASLRAFLQRVEVKLVNYKKDGTPFLNRLRITPLTTSLGQYTHMLGILEEVPAADKPAGKAAKEPRKLELQHL
jgi:hypothetical protein